MTTKHTWKLDGEIVDDFAFDIEDETTGHSGPRCTVCDFVFCTSCAKVRKVDPMDPEKYSCPGPPPEETEWYWFMIGGITPDAQPHGTISLRRSS